MTPTANFTLLLKQSNSFKNQFFSLKKFFVAFFFTGLFFGTANSQMTLQIGSPATNNVTYNYNLYNSFGPFRTTPAALTSNPVGNRHAYVFPASLLSTMPSGSSVDSIAFYKLFTGVLQGNPSLKIYLKNIASADFGTGSIEWASQIAGASLVYSADPTSVITTSVGYKKFKFNQGFVYSGGSIAVFTEYSQSTPTSDYVSWALILGTPGFLDNTLKYDNVVNSELPTSLTTSSNRHPVTQFFYTPPPVVPLKIAGLVVRNNAGINNLSWSIYTTDQINYFEIERSLDGVEFKKVSELPANINVGNGLYSWSDKTAGGISTVYYRIKALGAGGKSEYSNIVFLKLDAGSKILISPNPARNMLKLQVKSSMNISVVSEITVLDINGKTLYQKNLQLGPGLNSFNLDLSAMPAGFYKLIILTSSELLLQSFIKE